MIPYLYYSTNWCIYQIHLWFGCQSAAVYNTLMSSQKNREAGFITMIVLMVIVLIVAIGLAYLRVLRAQS